MFAGKVFVVTGGVSGIGRGLVNQFLKLGGTVCVLDTDQEGLGKLAARSAKYGESIVTIPIDLTDREAVKRAFNEIVLKWGRIHYWVNSAGISGAGSFSKTLQIEFDRVIEVNFSAAVYATRLVLAHMESMGGGVIVNLASVAGHVPVPFMSSYVAAKFALVGFSQSLQAELEINHSPVRIMVVSPGFVETPMLMDEKRIPFPKWLHWMLSPVDGVVKEIIDGLRRKKDFVVPTINGRVFLRMYRHFPRRTVRSTRVLLTQSFKDVLLNRYYVRN